MTIRGLRVGLLLGRTDRIGSYRKCVELRLLQFSLHFPDFGSGSDSLFPQTADYRVGSAAELHER